MCMAEHFMTHPEDLHGEIWLAFTPDEEIGEGTKHFDLTRFGADFAYTIDGGRIGEISYENFNAASAVITVTGRGVHPGDAYGKMINSIRIAGKIDSLIPTWIENGVNTMFPMEIGTWNASILPWREKYGKELLGIGGMNKQSGKTYDRQRYKYGLDFYCFQFLSAPILTMNIIVCFSFRLAHGVFYT